MTTTTETDVATQIYRVYIKASPQAIWDAITKPEWSERYGYGGRVEYDLRPGGTYRAFASEDMKQARAEMGGAPTPTSSSMARSSSPIRRGRLVQTWRMLRTWDTKAEGLRGSRTRSRRRCPASAGSRSPTSTTGAPRLAHVPRGREETRAPAAAGRSR